MIRKQVKHLLGLRLVADQILRLVKVVRQSIRLEVLCQRHLVTDRVNHVIVIVDAIVENSLDNEVFVGLDIEKNAFVIGENMLNRKRHVSASPGQIDIIVRLGIQFTINGATNTLVGVFVSIAPQHDTLYVVS